MTTRFVAALWLVGCVSLRAADVNTSQPDGTTPLHFAVQANDEVKVRALLDAGADPNAANRYGVTPLWLAATNGSASVTRLLLRAKADPKAKMPHSETALMAAARTGEPETVRVLLEAGADPNAFETSQGETALMWAAGEDHGDAIRALARGGADLNRHSKDLDLAPMDWAQVGMVSTPLPRGGFTAAMHAARQNAHEAMRALAEVGADLDARDPDGTTALLFAIMNQHYDLAIEMLDLGANPNVADNTGTTAMFEAADMLGFRSEIGRPAKVLPDISTAIDVLRAALRHGGDPNARLKKPAMGRHHNFPDASLGEGATALMRAAKGMDLDAMRVLLDAGADPKLGMTRGSNALMILATSRPGPGGGGGGTTKIADGIKLLTSHGADINAPDTKGDRPIHAAAQAGLNDTVKLLAEFGADLNATNGAGKTALDVVSQPGRNHHDDTAALLRELSTVSAAH